MEEAVERKLRPCSFCYPSDSSDAFTKTMEAVRQERILQEEEAEERRRAKRDEFDEWMAQHKAKQLERNRNIVPRGSEMPEQW